MATLNQKDLYFVALKVFLEDKNGYLFIFKDKFGDWDLPGGRLKQDDFNKSLEEVIKRKLKKELGEKVIYKLGRPMVFMRHERNEILSDGSRKKARIFAVGYKAEYLSGEINLGKNHLEYRFVNLKSFKAEKYFKSGWLQGIEEYKIKR